MSPDMTPNPKLPSPWRKSTRSTLGNHCLEMRSAASGVEVRDSKDAGGPALRFDATAWAAFIAAAATNRLEAPATWN
ncbi:DUF397 domain-containing protein [Dactylosporangium sp. CS-047395]|uniref:DUF397 domain-containing protein n=1 Tax=Dactylosporangium sp. CS-047395 TaxID=3239936 RepID=UPI003D9469ED